MSDIQVLSTSETISGDIKTSVQVILVNGEKKEITTTSKRTLADVKVNKNVLRRRQLPKFGKCKDAPPGPEPSITSVLRDVIEIRCLPKNKVVEEILIPKTEIERIAEGKTINICPKCGETGHMFLACPNNRPSEKTQRHETREKPIHTDISVKIQSLAVEVTDAELNALISKGQSTFGYCPPTRVTIVKNPQTNISRGQAYVNFPDLVNAQKFVDAFDQHRFNSLVLAVEIVQGRNEDRRQTRGDRYVLDDRAAKFEQFSVHKGK